MILRFVMLTQKRLKELLDYDPETGIFCWRVRPNRGGKIRVGEPITCKDNAGYIVIGVDRRLYKAHRLAWLYVYGSFPAGGLDHRDGVADNNRIDNLRLASQSQNNANRKTSRLGLKGVRFDKRWKRWTAAIQVKKRNLYLGTFNSEQEAHEAYMEAARKYFGEFARAA